MPVVKLYANGNAVIRKDSPSTYYGPVTIFQESPTTSGTELLFKFDKIEEKYRKLEVLSGRFYVYWEPLNTVADSYTVDKYDLEEPFDPNSVTFYTAPKRGWPHRLYFSKYDPGYKSFDIGTDSLEAENGLSLDNLWGMRVFSSGSAHPPYLEFNLGDPAALKGKLMTPSPGVVLNQCTDTNFYWYVSDNYSAFDVVTLSDAVFRWRVTGSSTYNDIPIGTKSDFDVPAGTFPAGSIDWCIVMTATSGAVSSTDWQTNSVAAPVVSDMSPSAGAYTPKYVDSIFSWSVQHFARNGSPIIVPLSAATVRWRVSGSSTVHTIPAGSSSSVVVPAGTFTADSIDWMVEAVTDTGVIVTSDWTTVSTIEAISSAVAVYPRDTTVDGSEPIVFRWTHVISTGSIQTAYEIQLSDNMESWGDLVNGEGADSSYSMSPGAMSAGEKYWRVRTYNTDDVAGEWSPPARFVVILPPSAPLISVIDGSPRFAIRWQQSGQQAYEVRVDGKVVARNFGENAMYRHDDYLDPGEYVVEVRIQNQYSMWSSWGRSSLAITNADAGSITLTAYSGNPVVLAWSTSGVFSEFWVYRNGVRIARTADQAFSDLYASGETEYYVKGISVDSGYFSLSNEAKVDATCESLMIADVELGHWLPLKLSETSLRSSSMSLVGSASYFHLVGDALPSAVVGKHKDEVCRVSCAFPVGDLASADVLENMAGKLVCVKSPDIKPFFAVLDSLDRLQNRFYRSYVLSLTRIDYREDV
jgi:hypothetical protein